MAWLRKQALGLDIDGPGGVTPPIGGPKPPMGGPAKPPMGMGGPVKPPMGGPAKPPTMEKEDIATADSVIKSLKSLIQREKSEGEKGEIKLLEDALKKVEDFKGKEDKEVKDEKKSPPKKEKSEDDDEKKDDKKEEKKEGEYE